MDAPFPLADALNSNPLSHVVWAIHAAIAEFQATSDLRHTLAPGTADKIGRILGEICRSWIDRDSWKE
jgi:hypothetical protein